MKETIRSDRAIKEAMIAYEILIFAQFNWNQHQRECVQFKNGKMNLCERCGEAFFQWKRARYDYLEKVKEMLK